MRASERDAARDGGGVGGGLKGLWPGSLSVRSGRARAGRRLNNLSTPSKFGVFAAFSAEASLRTLILLNYP